MACTALKTNFVCHESCLDGSQLSTDSAYLKCVLKQLSRRFHVKYTMQDWGLALILEASVKVEMCLGYKAVYTASGLTS